MFKFLAGTVFGAFAWTGIAMILVRYAMSKDVAMESIDDLTTFRD